MTREEMLVLVGAAEADAKRGTPGPWRTHSPGVGSGDHICGWDGDDANAEGSYGGFHATGPDTWSKAEALVDAEIIATTRTREPKLAAAVRELLGRLDLAESACCMRTGGGACTREGSSCAHCHLDFQRQDAEIERDEALAELARIQRIHAGHVAYGSDEHQEMYTPLAMRLAAERDAAVAERPRAEAGDGGLGAMIGRFAVTGRCMPAPDTSQDVAFLGFAIDRLAEQLAAMTAARDDLADLADEGWGIVDTQGGVMRGDEADRIAALRVVGTKARAEDAEATRRAIATAETERKLSATPYNGKNS